MTLARRTNIRLEPDSRRVFTRMFVAGQEDFGSRQSRTSLVIDRVLALSDEEVRAAVDDIGRRFTLRHGDLSYWLDLHAHRVTSRLDPTWDVSEDRWRLMGAFFTHEFSVEGAALTNPSMVLHPDQRGLADDTVRFVMSVRGIGEGHRSSIGFRTGTIDGRGRVKVDPARPHLHPGIHGDSTMHRKSFQGLLEEVDDFGENARYVLSQLDEVFSESELEEQLNRLHHDRDAYRYAEDTIKHFRMIMDRAYTVKFPDTRDLSERILWPYSDAERRGMEDARFVHFTHSDGQKEYFASYTAFDGTEISQQLLRTSDFLTFSTFPISGAAAHGKGLALFPRKVGGRYVALTRADHESNSVAFSDDLEYWSNATQVQRPLRSWEAIQLGNCGSPIETEAGWLVLTHGVGPMRTYSIGAMLLDIDDPSVVLGTLDQPLLSPIEDERDGYVPNVVYSCGSMRHQDTLVLPFGIADNHVGVATASISEVLSHLIT